MGGRGWVVDGRGWRVSVGWWGVWVEGGGGVEGGYLVTVAIS